MPDAAELIGVRGLSETSASVAARVAKARERQRKRYEAVGRPDVMTNAAAPASLLEDLVDLDRWNGCRPPQTASQCASMVIVEP